MKKFFFIVSLVAILLPSAGYSAANPVELYFFEAQGCSHCARMASYLEGLKADYPNLIVKDFEVYFNKDNQDLFQKMAAAYGADAGSVPTLFIDDEVIKGEAYEKVKNAVERCSTEVCISPASKIEANTNENTNTNRPTSGGNETVGWAILVGGAVVFTVLLIFFILKKKKDVR